MSVKSLPTQERPREKLLRKGTEQLTNTELLAILIGSGYAGRSALEIARDLLVQTGTLQTLFHMPEVEFVQMNGVNTVTYCRLQAISELFNRQLQEYLERDDPLANPDVTRRFLISKLRHLRHEVFAILYLDNAHRLIQFDILFEGTINSANVYPRRVLQEAIRYNAAAVILAHNHPSGVSEPSQADKQITDTLVKTLNLVDIRVLDHFIIGQSEALSFAEQGLL